MESVYKDLYRFSSYVEPIDLTFNQYLLLSEESILVHTGSIPMAKALVPQLKERLGSQGLDYVFVSHFESDECGGIMEILAAFPNTKVICPEVTARQFSGFGMDVDVIVQKGGDALKIAGSNLAFISYPSEVHLWEGLLLFEESRGILFSSDLVFQFGKADEGCIVSDWKKEVANITPEQLPDPNGRTKLQEELDVLPVQFVATGHGPCVKI